MPLAAESRHLLLPLHNRPIIRQAGMGEHGMRSQETFYRPNDWALHLYFWKGHLRFSGNRFEIQPHDLGLTPPDTSLTWDFPLEPCRHYFVHFTFDQTSKAEANAMETLPTMCSLNQRFEPVRQQFEKILNWSQSNRTRAEIMLWDLLWMMTDFGQPVKPLLNVRPGPIETALGIIENELDNKLNAKSLAARVALSYTQLNRLFKEHVGTTLSEYITTERFTRASHLLLETNLPIKAIAERVGIPNIQHFNKFIRLRAGMSPRKFRSEQTQT